MVRAGYPSVGLIPFPRTGRSVAMSEPESPELPKRFFGLKQTGKAVQESWLSKVKNKKCLKASCWVPLVMFRS